MLVISVLVKCFRRIIKTKTGTSKIIYRKIVKFYNYYFFYNIKLIPLKMNFGVIEGRYNLGAEGGVTEGDCKAYNVV